MYGLIVKYGFILDRLIRLFTLALFTTLVNGNMCILMFCIWGMPAPGSCRRHVYCPPISPRTPALLLILKPILYRFALRYQVFGEYFDIHPRLLFVHKQKLFASPKIPLLHQQFCSSIIFGSVPTGHMFSDGKLPELPHASSKGDCCYLAGWIHSFSFLVQSVRHLIAMYVRIPGIQVRVITLVLPRLVSACSPKRRLREGLWLLLCCLNR